MALCQRLFIAGVVSFIFFAAAGQTRQVHGKVTSNGEALSGGNVMIKGTITGTLTDRDGRFAIDVPVGKSVVLLFSFMGPLMKGEFRRTNKTSMLTSTQVSDHMLYIFWRARPWQSYPVKGTMKSALRFRPDTDIGITGLGSVQRSISSREPSLARGPLFRRSVYQ